MSAVSIYLLISPRILYGFIPEVKFASPLSDTNNETGRAENVAPEISINDREKRDDGSLQSVLDERELSAELAIVLSHMTQNKPFKKKGFTIQELSNQTGIPVYQLSPLINGYFKMNFANWINRYRIEFFIELARENPQITLEALSHMAGFTSRSTFINAFKKEKGVTPREYLKELHLSE